jgi:hypothetical protein
MEPAAGRRLARHEKAHRVEFRRRAALANMVIPREQQCYPRSALPASKFEQGGESR